VLRSTQGDCHVMIFMTTMALSLLFFATKIPQIGVNSTWRHISSCFCCFLVWQQFMVVVVRFTLLLPTCISNMSPPTNALSHN